MKLKVLVTGTGRCGTTYAAHLLTKMGIPCGHESIFTTEGLIAAKYRLSNPESIIFSKCAEDMPLWTDPWDIVADSSYLSAPFVNEEILKTTKIIRVIRNPLQVIASYVFDAKYFLDEVGPITKPFQDFIKLHLPCVYDNDFSPINRAAIFYIEWNNLILKNKKVFTFKVESDTQELADFLEVNNVFFNNKKINSWNNNNRPNLSYEDFKEPLKSKLKEYNYSRKMFI